MVSGCDESNEKIESSRNKNRIEPKTEIETQIKLSNN